SNSSDRHHGVVRRDGDTRTLDVVAIAILAVTSAWLLVTSRHDQTDLIHPACGRHAGECETHPSRDNLGIADQDLSSIYLHIPASPSTLRSVRCKHTEDVYV